MSDQLETLFTDLRAETIRQVRPPGVAAARQTVRHRRLGAAGAAVVAVAIVVGGVQYAIGGTPPGPVAAAPGAMSPQERAERAVADKPGKTWAGVVTKPTYIALPPLEAGAYQIYIACTGLGSIGLDLRVGNQSRSGQNISCADSPRVEQMSLSVTTRTSFTLLLNGTDEPAYALKVVPDADPVADAPPPNEEASFNAGLAGDLLTAGGEAHLMTTETRQVIEAGTFGTGDLLVSYACAGPGKITFSIVTTPVGPGTPTRSDDLLECSSLGSVRSNTLTSLDGRSTVTITAAPDTAAGNHAGWAYLIR